jgi:hypothetical protein
MSIASLKAALAAMRRDLPGPARPLTLEEERAGAMGLVAAIRAMGDDIGRTGERWWHWLDKLVAEMPEARDQAALLESMVSDPAVMTGDPPLPPRTTS